MVERYVFIKLKDAMSTAERRREVVERARAVLPTVPGVVSVRVGEPADGAAVASWDVSIAVRFASIDAVEPYRAHPDHRAFVDGFIRPRMQIIKAWNFDIGDAP